MTGHSPATTAFRVCDRRWPFLWADDHQPLGRWHGAGEGPCHYLSNTAEAAWAEYLRHAGIRDGDELEDVERSVWAVHVVPPLAEPHLPEKVVSGGKSSHRRCQAEARRLRVAGATGLRDPSAALLPPGASVYSVDASGQHIVGSVPATTYAIFGEAVGLQGLHVAEGRPDPTVLDRVRHL